MKIRNLIIASTAVALTLVSCDVYQEKCNTCSVSRVNVKLGGSVPVVVTRAEGVKEEDEYAVNSVQLYVFSSADGRFVERMTYSESSYDFYLFNSTYDFLAFVNCPELPAAPESRAVLEKTVSKLSDNGTANIQMCGALERQTIQADSQLTVEVSRIVAKVTYVCRVEMKSATLAAEPFHVKELFMTNVCGENDYALDAAPGLEGIWYNRRNLESSGTVSNLISSGEMEHIVPQGDSIQTGHTFYVYPNPFSDPDDRSGWSQRRTRFVLKAEIGGMNTYYPVTIPCVERNKHYEIDLTITGRGVDDPEDIPGTSFLAEAAIRVADWEDGGKIEALY